MKAAYDIMLTLNRRMNRKQFNAEYCRIRLFIKYQKEEVQ